MGTSLFACSQPEPVPRSKELLAPPPGGMGVQLGMATKVAPGEETTLCQYFALPEVAGGPDVTRFEHRYTFGSHHIVLLPTRLPRAPKGREGMFECDAATVPLSDLGVTGVAYADQLDEGVLSFPPGIGYHFDEGRVVLMQAHYLNATMETIEADVRLNVWLAEQPVSQQAGTLFFNHLAIYVPPAPAGARATMRCAVDQDITLLMGLSHMHRRGTHFESFLDGPPLGQPLSLHTAEDWSSPSPVRFDPAVAVSAGQTIELSCDFVNDRDAATITGSSAADDEMCIFAVSYYPKGSDALEQCLGPESGVIQHGTRTCMESIACSEAVYPGGDEAAWLACAADTCPASSPAYDNLFDLGCDGLKLCPDGDFTTCLAAACPEQWAACEAAACEAAP